MTPSQRFANGLRSNSLVVRFEIRAGLQSRNGVPHDVMSQQASLKACIDMFCWTAPIVAICLPGAWLLKTATANGNVALN